MRSYKQPNILHIITLTITTLCVLSVFVLCGCTNSNETTDELPQPDVHEEQEPQIKQDVTVVIPYVLFENGLDKEAIAQKHMEAGYDVTDAEDGGLSITIPEKEYAAIKDELKSTITSQIVDKSDSKSYSSLVEITPDDSLTHVQITCSSKTRYLERNNHAVEHEIALLAHYYQAFANEPLECVIDVKENDGENFRTMSYPGGFTLDEENEAEGEE